jgi:20S proteasome subunit beta 5
MAGNSSVRCKLFLYLHHDLLSYSGNYDITKLHYEGPGNVAGSPGHGYGYDLRVEGRSSANPPEALAQA